MDITMEPHSGPSLVGMIKSIWESMKAPGKAYNEGMTTDEMIKAGNDFALNMGLGGSLVPKTPSSLGMFGGKLAKTANLEMLKSAERFERAGANPDSIWKATGWGRGPDGKWRFEIPDNNSGFRPKAFDKLNNSRGLNITDIYDHPALFEAYPQLANTKVIPEQTTAYGTSYGGKVAIRGPNSFHQPDSTMLHELQHETQDIENFARGANTNTIRDDILAELLKAGRDRMESNKSLWDVSNRDLYNATAGEVEARNVQKRQNYTPLQRAMQTPWSTEDVPRFKQLLLGITDK